MGEVIAINQKRFFSLEEAKQVLSVIKRITKAANHKTKALGSQLESVSDPNRKKEIEEEVYRVFKEWHLKIRKLGAEAKGMWLVDFDSGRGFYCWKFPEDDITYFHGYEDGFQGRMEIH